MYNAHMCNVGGLLHLFHSFHTQLLLREKKSMLIYIILKLSSSEEDGETLLSLNTTHS